MACESMPLTRDHEALAHLCGPSGLMTAKDVSFATGLHSHYVYEFLNGRRNVTAQMWNQILRYAVRWIPANIQRFVAIANTVCPLFLEGTPIHPEIAFVVPLDGRPVPEVAREAAVLCETVGGILRGLAEIFADGRIDAADDPTLADLRDKTALLNVRLQSILTYCAHQRSGAAKVEARRA